jgi:hypothetical protein
VAPIKKRSLQPLPGKRRTAGKLYRKACLPEVAFRWALCVPRLDAREVEERRAIAVGALGTRSA